MQLDFQFNDGGRSKYYKATKVDDCVTRAIAIATERDYKEVYNLIKSYMKGATPRNGVLKKIIVEVMNDLGCEWVAKMKIGSGCTTHLRKGEIPMDKRIICSCSGHLVAVINGVINDTYNCARGGNRCVYGYWIVK